MLLTKIFKRKCSKERTIILDTCACESDKILQVIERATKVILLCGIIDEMDAHKRENSLFGANIREVSRRSRKDKKSEKYVCVAGYERHSYNDKNIIDYCREHKRTIIVTGDNNLCNYAKAYGIHYIFLKKTIQEKKIVAVEVPQEKKTVNVKSKKKKKKKVKKVIRQNLKGVNYEKGKLYISKKKNKNFFLYRNDKLVEDISNDVIELEIGDTIYMLRNNANGYNLEEYEIQVIRENSYAFCKRRELIENSKIHNLEKVPVEVINGASYLLDLKAKILQENKKIHFYKNWIGVNRYKEYHTEVKLERNGELIKIQDYQEGDYLYILRYNISNKYVEIDVFEIILESDIYDVRDVEKQRVYYINEIYKLNYSEELQEEIRKLLLSDTKY